MAKATINVTTSWQLIASGAVAITVDTAGSKTLIFNEAASDTNATEFIAEKSDQWIQDEAKATYVKSSHTGWVLIADGDL